MFGILRFKYFLKKSSGKELVCQTSSIPIHWIILQVVQVESSRQHDVLARKLPLHQGDLRDAPHEDGRVDGERGEVHCKDHGWQGLHICRIQTRERKFPRKYFFSLSCISIFWFSSGHLMIFWKTKQGKSSVTKDDLKSLFQLKKLSQKSLILHWIVNFTN